LRCPAYCEKPWSSFWHFTDSIDNDSTSSFKTFDINITHPVRATQLAIDSFIRQKLGHGVVVIISSIAAQFCSLPTPMYSASKHAISGFTRALADLEPKLNIRVNAVAPGCVKTPIWTQDKLPWVDEDVDTWVTAKQVADVMLDLITNENNVGGTVLEVGADKVRAVQELNDPGPQGNGFTIAHFGGAITNVYDLVKEQYGK
jgi:NAD(P)-dependent dehydrogenase (short-subunit alcohol dehydrogenase family)